MDNEEYSDLHRGEFFAGIREIFDDAPVSTEFTDRGLEGVDDGCDVAVAVAFAVRAAVLTVVFSMRKGEIEDLEVGEGRRA